MSGVTRLIVATYAWVATVLFGAIALDVAYARAASAELADVRDLLLGIVAVAIVAGIGAVAASWTWERTRYLLLASLVLVIAELLAPALLSGVVGEAEASSGFSVGPWIRLAGGAGASLLAFAGLLVSDRPAAGPRD